MFAQKEKKKKYLKCNSGPGLLSTPPASICNPQLPFSADPFESATSSNPLYFVLYKFKCQTFFYEKKCQTNMGGTYILAIFPNERDPYMGWLILWHFASPVTQAFLLKY